MCSKFERVKQLIPAIHHLSHRVSQQKMPVQGPSWSVEIPAPSLMQSLRPLQAFQHLPLSKDTLVCVYALVCTHVKPRGPCQELHSFPPYSLRQGLLIDPELASLARQSSQQGPASFSLCPVLQDRDDRHTLLPLAFMWVLGVELRFFLVLTQQACHRLSCATLPHIPRASGFRQDASQCAQDRCGLGPVNKDTVVLRVFGLGNPSLWKTSRSFCSQMFWF